MKRILLEILRCPDCRSELILTVDVMTGGEEIDAGWLRCMHCNRNHPITQGVPRLILSDGPDKKTRNGFTYQWNKRHRGRAEGCQVVYGYSLPKFMAWFIREFTPCLRRHSNTYWILDAGCGSGEKAVALAEHYPKHQVVAIDQSYSIITAASAHRERTNLHFVQANVWKPPFAQHCMRFAMSIGVLNHTPSTKRAFHSIAALIAPEGDFATWIYPLPDEDSFWAGLYKQRDRHFLGIAHLLPNWMVLMLVRIYVALFFFPILRFLRAQYRINRNRFPIYPDHPSLRNL
jgi:uncharacterized protein YbaR (Trm112 family)